MSNIGLNCISIDQETIYT